MWLQNPLPAGSQTPESASENTKASPARRRGRAAVDLPASEAAVLHDYTEALRSAPLSDQTRRTYASKVRQFLAWLASAGLDGDPLASADGRDWTRSVPPRTSVVAKVKRSIVQQKYAETLDAIYRSPNDHTAARPRR